MTRVVVVTPEELAEIVEAAVQRALAERAPEPVEWLDTAGAAAVLGVHRKSAERLARTGELPSTRVGRLYRFARADLEAYLRGRR